MMTLLSNLSVSGAVTVAAGLLLSGCMKNLPTAPSELTNSIHAHLRACRLRR